MPCSLACEAAARALISAIDPFFGAFAESDVTGGAVVGGVERLAIVEAGVLRAAPKSEADIDEGLPAVTSDGFLEANKAGLSFVGRGVLDDEGLDDPV